MSSGQYSVHSMLRIHGDGVTRPGTPERTTTPPRTKPKPTVKEEPKHAYGEELYVTIIRKLHAVGEKWASKPYVPENFHKALEEVCAVIGGHDGLPPLSAAPSDEKATTCDIYRNGKHQPLLVDYKASFDFRNARRDYRKLRNAAADHQVSEDD